MINSQVLDKLDDYKQLYMENGWASIPNFYDAEFAESLFNRLRSERQWEIATLRNGQPFVAGLQEFHQQPPQFKQNFMNEILNYAAKNKFQYFYEFIRLIGADSQNVCGYDDLKDCLLNDSYQETMCRLTSLEKNEMLEKDSRLDAQFTKYAPGCFLKQHCDTRLSGETKRHAAMILSLTKNWSADYGGLLNIQSPNGTVIKTLTPEFNTLTLMSIPFEHFVSQVANYANRNRYSLIGWLWKKS